MRTIIEVVCAVLCFLFGKCRQRKWFRMPVERRLMIALVRDGKQ